ncbi:MAG: Phage-associated protein [Candidatus Tokpelaia hoelldobleri]|uniref:Phage-associated protein n=1 Tax=Candidatus Tokpelaia hoelldobleri TaxID=1902579 RepID=A0A1U9JVQ4_9HYPH|nr:MAG: Phage-associated protein [Candidatus Tokpelaia hoelldoblerii]
MNERTQDARAIANYILGIAPEYEIKNLTLMQLLKLVFLSHGWSFAFGDVPLVAQAPQAWQYGPVYPQVYKALSKYGGTPISGNERIIDSTTGFPFLPVDLTDKQKSVINAVMLSYGKMHAFELSNITHMEDSPWDKTIKELGIYKDISPTAMKVYYKNLAAERDIKGL